MNWNIATITKKWVESWISILLIYKDIFEMCVDEWYKTISDVNINQVAKQKIFYNKWIKLLEVEQKRLRKSIIHHFVWLRDKIKIIYWTENLKEILDKICDTIEKLKNY
jgi:hypothetical protein